MPKKDKQKLLATIDVIQEKGLLVAQRMEWVKQLDNDIETIKFQNIVHFFKEFCDSDDWADFTQDQLEIFDEIIELQELLHNYSTNKSVSLTVTIPEEELLIFKELMKKQPNWKIEE